MKWFGVLAAVLLLALYLRSPIDFIPDRVGLIGILDDLIALAFTIWWVRQRLGQAGPRRPPWGTAESGSADSARAADPYEILGITHGASAEEITHAYREQMKRYHPDRVADLGEELQRVAHRKAVEIQRAYEALRRS